MFISAWYHSPYTEPTVNNLTVQKYSDTHMRNLIFSSNAPSELGHKDECYIFSYFPHCLKNIEN